MTRYEWSEELQEYGHWGRYFVDGNPERVWVPHCKKHFQFSVPCKVCEALCLGTDEGPEA